MPRIKNGSVPVGELVHELAGKTLSTALKSSSGPGADYIIPRTMQIPFSAGISSEVAFAVQNPETYPLVIRGATLVVTIPGASSAVIDIGIVASSSKTAVDLVSSGAIDAAGVYPIIMGYRLNDAGSSAITPVSLSIWEKNGFSSDDWLTGKIKVDSASSFAGYLLLEVVPFFST